MLVLYFLAILYLSCFSNENKKFLHLGSLTPYRFLANNNVTEPKFEGCVSKKIWMVVRHGTRNPTLNYIRKFKERLPQIRNEILLNSILSAYQREHLEKWHFQIHENEAYELREEGKEEMLLLAERMQKRFPLLFPSTYNESIFSFKRTTNKRTKDSACWFLNGLFEQPEAENIYIDVNNFVLRFYKYCKKWKEEVKNNPVVYKEQELFDDSAIMTSILHNLTVQLNLSTKLEKGDVKLMYHMCAYEIAWNEEKAVWCDFLSLELMKVLEFSSNLKSYYVDAYAHSISYKQACVLFNDMMQHLTSDKSSPTTSVYFTHSGTILKYLAFLGLYKDEHPPTHTDYGNITMKWNRSILDPFSANIAFVKYTCGSQHKLLVLHQERIVRLPNCTDLCDLNTVKEIYYNSLNCEFHKMCNQKS